MAMHEHAVPPYHGAPTPRHGSSSRRAWLLHLADHVGGAMILDRAAALARRALVDAGDAAGGSAQIVTGGG